MRPCLATRSTTVGALSSLFLAKITDFIQPAAEIEEIIWIEPSRPGDLALAPLTRDHALPLILSRKS
jgi:hypothetical protein